MEKPGSTRNVGGIEENILAILGSSEAKDNQDAYEDRITFLEAVRAASIVPKDGTPHKSKSSSSVPELVVVEGVLSSEIASNEKGAANNSRRPVDSYSFQLLMQEFVDATGEANFQASETKIMELDVSKQSADTQGSTTRADGIRTPLLEMILEELTHNKEILDPFLQYTWFRRMEISSLGREALFTAAYDSITRVIICYRSAANSIR